MIERTWQNLWPATFKPSEAVSIGEAIEAMEKPKAKERIVAAGERGVEGGRGNKKKNPVKSLHRVSGDQPTRNPPVRDIVAQAVGMSGPKPSSRPLLRRPVSVARRLHLAEQPDQLAVGVAALVQVVRERWTGGIVGRVGLDRRELPSPRRSTHIPEYASTLRAGYSVTGLSPIFPIKP